LFHEEGKALAIHAGLECGLFSEKYPDMDMVSYGPTMRGVHSPDEKVSISTVERFWKLTVELLKRF
ncbi:MAG: cytosol nonspecific dipeptidase, partial [Bacteroidales bacterium]|nr:cytosol nonspecific dipeptidase [Bacteroidales bacterium]